MVFRPASWSHSLSPVRRSVTSTRKWLMRMSFRWCSAPRSQFLHYPAGQLAPAVGLFSTPHASPACWLPARSKSPPHLSQSFANHETALDADAESNFPQFRPNFPFKFTPPYFPVTSRVIIILYTLTWPVHVSVLHHLVHATVAQFPDDAYL